MPDSSSDKAGIESRHGNSAFGDDPGRQGRVKRRPDVEEGKFQRQADRERSPAEGYAISIESIGQLRPQAANVGNGRLGWTVLIHQSRYSELRMSDG